MKLRIWLPILLVAAGVFLCGYGGFQLWRHHTQEKVTLQKALTLTTIKQDPIKFKNFNPYKGETIGLVELPTLKATLPIVEGTNENQLAKGVGHYKTSKFPNQHNQVVLSGHRDTVFRHIGQLKIGDKIILHFPFGTYTYKIDHTKIVMADDRTIIHSTYPKEELLLTTCYPFYYIGNAPKRYLIYAYRTSS